MYNNYIDKYVLLYLMTTNYNNTFKILFNQLKQILINNKYTKTQIQSFFTKIQKTQKNYDKFKFAIDTNTAIDIFINNYFYCGIDEYCENDRNNIYNIGTYLNIINEKYNKDYFEKIFLQLTDNSKQLLLDYLNLLLKLLNEDLN